jgi:3-dehydroquinate synthase
MRLTVDASGQSYPVHLQDGGLEGLGACVREAFPAASRLICIVDERVQELFGRTLAVSLQDFDAQFLVVSGGEDAKTVAEWERLVLEALELGVDRATPIVAVGGGSIGDLAGFVAATVMRGVPLIQVPTTLLSMVDSSVGGKTGVNTRHGKNLIGAFHQPSLVYAAMDTLLSLTDEQFLSGLGEVVKHAVLGDEALFEVCRDRRVEIRQRKRSVLKELVRASIELKASVVAEDEKEHGIRAILNLGHTVGHALEKVAFDDGCPIPHGLCIAMGVAAEVAWAESMGGCRQGTSGAVRSVLTGLGLPVRPDRFDLESALRAVRFDKKVRRGTLTTAMVERVGRVRLVSVSQTEVRAMFHALEDAEDAYTTR